MVSHQRRFMSSSQSVWPARRWLKPFMWTLRLTTTGDGSPASPFKTIGEAITASAAVDEIRIAGGTYDNEPPYMALKGQQIISGSYDSAFTTSDPSVTPTIIDMAHLTQQQQNRTFRCQAVTSFTIENLVIKNSSTGESGNTTNGGAIYVQNGSSGTHPSASRSSIAPRNSKAASRAGRPATAARCVYATLRRSSLKTASSIAAPPSAMAAPSACAMPGAGNNVKIRRCLFTHCGSRNGASAIHDADGGQPD